MSVKIYLEMNYMSSIRYKNTVVLFIALVI